MRTDVRSILPHRPPLCLSRTPLGEVIRLLIEHDSPALPVVSEGRNPFLLGIVTSGDVVHAGKGRDSSFRRLTARDVMTAPRIVVRMELSLEDCARVLREYRAAAAPVVDRWGHCHGAVTQVQLERLLTPSTHNWAMTGATGTPGSLF